MSACTQRKTRRIGVSKAIFERAAKYREGAGFVKDASKGRERSENEGGKVWCTKLHGGGGTGL